MGRVKEGGGREREKFYTFISFHIFIIMQRLKEVHILYRAKT